MRADVEEDEGAKSFVRAKTRPGRTVGLPIIDVCGTVLHGYNPDTIDDALTRPR